MQKSWDSTEKSRDSTEKSWDSTEKSCDSTEKSWDSTEMVYTGRTGLQAKTQNETQENLLSDWSFKTWEGVKFFLHNSSLHERSKYKLHGKQNKGQHVD